MNLLRKVRPQSRLHWLAAASLAWAASTVAGDTLRANERTRQHVELQTKSPKANIVLVHGALTDALVWTDVISNLQEQRYSVFAAAMPLRGLASDAVYLTSFLKTIHGPIVSVGHSWAGQVISQAAENLPEIEALVYVAAFQPDDGESAGTLNAKFPGSKRARSRVREVEGSHAVPVAHPEAVVDLIVAAVREVAGKS